MPTNPTYPGVYIEEIPSGIRPIVGVATSVAAFIGFFKRSPMDQAIQIFNMGDFQREFGGLHTDSEASYAIDQFFKNGGSEAWVVRTARADTYATAEVSLEDEDGATGAVLRVTAGRRLKGTSVDNPGDWGNNLRIDIDYNTSTPDSSFNLIVSEVTFQNDRQVTIQTETYRNLTMNRTDINFVEDVVNDRSRLVQVSLLTDDSDTIPPRPAQTGTVGTVVDLNEMINNLESGNTFTITIDAVQFEATLQFEQSLSQNNMTSVQVLNEVRRALETAIRAAGADPTLGAPEPLLTGATVELVGAQFRVLAGRSGSGFNAHTILRFADGDSGQPATNMGLSDATANVQLYSVGSQESTGRQLGGRIGADGEPPGATELRGIRDGKTGMYALEDVDLFNILCIPRAAEIGLNEMQAVYSEAIDYCEERRAFIIIDIPEVTNNLQTAREWLEDNALLRHRNAASYFPRPRIPDPLDDYRLRSVGASGTIAGLYARTDAARGVWKAPAGIEGVLRNVPDLDYKLTDAENGQLNPLGLNCLRNFDLFGNVCWGARTLDGSDRLASEWKYVPVRRIALFIEESLFRGTKWVVFEPNDEPLWAQIRLNAGSFMHNLFRKGAFQGSTPRDAYLVKCDSETTTQDDINRGIVNILVGFAPLRPAEFVMISIRQLAGQLEA